MNIWCPPKDHTYLTNLRLSAAGLSIHSFLGIPGIKQNPISKSFRHKTLPNHSFKMQTLTQTDNSNLRKNTPTNKQMHSKKNGFEGLKP